MLPRVRVNQAALDKIESTRGDRSFVELLPISGSDHSRLNLRGHGKYLALFHGVATQVRATRNAISEKQVKYPGSLVKTRFLLQLVGCCRRAWAGRRLGKEGSSSTHTEYRTGAWRSCRLYRTYTELLADARAFRLITEIDPMWFGHTSSPALRGPASTSPRGSKSGPSSMPSFLFAEFCLVVVT